jgi:hypothetical protein
VPYSTWIIIRLLSISLTFSPTASEATQFGGVRRGQRCAALQTGHRFEKAHDLICTEHERQLAWLAGIRDALRQIGLDERHAVEEAQRTDDLIVGWPGEPRATNCT